MVKQLLRDAHRSLFRFACWGPPITIPIAPVAPRRRPGGMRMAADRYHDQV